MEEINWKEERIIRYTELITEKTNINRELETDAEINKLKIEYEDLSDAIATLQYPFQKRIEAIEEQQANIKSELVKRWDIPEKTYECDTGIATLRTTKSLRINNKSKLVEFLILNKKLVDFIKSFEISKLRKIKDAGMLGEEIASWDENKNVVIKEKK